LRCNLRTGYAIIRLCKSLNADTVLGEL
jgi:hypothetical protein